MGPFTMRMSRPVPQGWSRSHRRSLTERAEQRPANDVRRSGLQQAARQAIRQPCRQPSLSRLSSNRRDMRLLDQPRGRRAPAADHWSSGTHQICICNDGERVRAPEHLRIARGWGLRALAMMNSLSSFSMALFSSAHPAQGSTHLRASTCIHPRLMTAGS